MSRWSELATWVGPTPNEGGALTVHRGLVVHIAEGYYQGTISWQRNPSADVSSHFIVSRSGQIAQMVDTDRRAWTQRDGNGSWMSVEMEGFTAGHRLHKPGWERLSTGQIEAAARLLVKMHRQYGVPLQVATGAAGRGLGHHSMGGDSWGHRACPGAPIIGQKAEIVARARQLVGAPTPPPQQGGGGNWKTEAVARMDTIKQGARGVTVGRGQALLNVEGGGLTEDRDFGPKTTAAARRFQARHGLVVDGVIGPKTWTKLLGV